MFGKDSGFCLTYEYGCRTPIFNEERAIEEMRKMNTLWNKFMEIDRKYNELYRSVVKVPEVEDENSKPIGRYNICLTYQINEATKTKDERLNVKCVIIRQRCHQFIYFLKYFVSE